MMITGFTITWEQVETDACTWLYHYCPKQVVLLSNPVTKTEETLLLCCWLHQKPSQCLRIDKATTFPHQLAALPGQDQALGHKLGIQGSSLKISEIPLDMVGLLWRNEEAGGCDLVPCVSISMISLPPPEKAASNCFLNY